jgi:hypothetical protein
MNHTIVLNLLACALNFNGKSKNEIRIEIEVLEENIDEFKNVEVDSILIRNEFESLYRNLIKFFNDELNLPMDKIQKDNFDWVEIRIQAINILNSLEIEIITPNEYLDRNDWED